MVDTIIYEERTPLFLASAYSPEDAADERGLTLEEAHITEEWLVAQDLTPEQIQDPEYQYDLNPDYEEGDQVAERIYLTAKPNAPHANKYLRVQAVAAPQP